MGKFYLSLGGQLSDTELKKKSYKYHLLLNLVKVIPKTKEEIHTLYLSFEKKCISLGKKTNHLLDFISLNEIKVMESFKKELKVWAEKWYINYDWTVELLFQTFMVWFENENNKYNLTILDPRIGKAKNLAQKVKKEGNFDLPDFVPTIMTDIEYRNYVDKIITAYMQQTRIKFKEEGYLEAEEKRTNQHFHWFICFHILGWSVDDISIEFSDDDNLNGGINIDNIRGELRKIYKYTEINRKNRNKGKK